MDVPNTPSQVTHFEDTAISNIVADDSGIIDGIKSSVANIVSGGMNVIFDRVNIGDYLEYKNQIGKVQKTSLLSTTILTMDGRLISIPNRKISNNKILRSSIEYNHKPDLSFVLKDVDQADLAKEIVQGIIRTSIDLGSASDATNTIYITRNRNCKMILCALSYSESKDTWESLWSLKKEMYAALLLAGCIDIEK